MLTDVDMTALYLELPLMIIQRDKSLTAVCMQYGMGDYCGGARQCHIWYGEAAAKGRRIWYGARMVWETAAKGGAYGMGDCRQLTHAMAAARSARRASSKGELGAARQRQQLTQTTAARVR